jgi:hypothetical protein
MCRIGPGTTSASTGCVPGRGVGSLDVKALSYGTRGVDLKRQSHRLYGGGGGTMER